MNLYILQAVKRSRVKSKMRTQQTVERVNQLKTENELLEEKIKMLTKELGFLKDLFLAHAGVVFRRGRSGRPASVSLSDLIISRSSGSSQHSINLQDLDLNALLAEDKSNESLKTNSAK